MVVVAVNIVVMIVVCVVEQLCPLGFALVVDSSFRPMWDRH